MKDIKEKKTGNAPFILVTGTGRCGTQAMGKALDLESEFGLHDRPDLGRVLRLPRGIYNAIMEKRPSLITNPFDKKVFRERYSKCLYEKTHSITPMRGDACNVAAYAIEEIINQIPNSKVIYMIRNGRDFVCSAVSRKWDTYNRFSHTPPRSDPIAVEWAHMCPIARCAWIWSYRNKYGLKNLDGVSPSRKMIIKLEDLREDNTLLLKQIEDFIEDKIPNPEFLYSKYNTNNYKVVQTKYRDRYVYPHEWDDKECSAFEKYAGNMMRRLGYD